MTGAASYMFIVHVVRQFYPAVGGFESVVLELASAQVAAGHRVRVVTLDRLFNTSDAVRLPARGVVAGAEIVRIPFFGSSRYPIAWSVLRHIGDADAVHVHAIDFFFDWLAWTKPLHGRKLVVSTHGGFFHTPYAAALKRLYFSTVTRLSLTWYAGVAAVSAADYEQFSRIRPRGMVCIENGVNVAKYAAAGSATPRKAILAVGRLSSNKRLDRLIAFLAALRRRDPEWTLTIAGRPWDVEPADLAALAASHGVREAVQIVVAPSDEDIRRRMGACSVLASASDYEGFGLAAIEGMSAGLYPLLSDIAPFRRLVARTGLGTIVDYARPEAAAEQCLDAWRKLAGAYAERRAAAMDAASRFDWRGISQAYTALYEAVIGSKVRALLDVPVQVGTLSDAVALLDARFEHGSPVIVAFANAHSMNVAAADPRFRRLMQSSIVFNDGIGADIASRILYGASFPENLNGTDFSPCYLQRTCHRYRVFLLGCRPGIAERAAREFARRCPGHEIVGCHDGFFPAEATADVVAQIRASRADVILVAMGNPRQELWLRDHLAATGCRLGFGVGALFDFMAGEVPRAQSWVRSARLEWAYRLLQEPRRLWRRYLVGIPIFLLRVLRQWWSGPRVEAPPRLSDQAFADAALPSDAPLPQTTPT